MSLANKVAKAQYMGDPGLFGDIWGGIKSVGRAASGIVGSLGIPVVSGVANIAGRTLFGSSPRHQIPGASTFASPAPPMTISMAGAMQQGGGPGRPPQGINLPFHGAPGAGIGRLSVGERGPVSPAASGYHWNKTGYYTKSEGWIEPYTKMVKNRRRNPGNMRALSRSLGRVKSAKKMAKALSAVTIRETCK